jgi:hypothetical protein
MDFVSAFELLIPNRYKKMREYINNRRKEGLIYLYRKKTTPMLVAST